MSLQRERRDIYDENRSLLDKAYYQGDELAPGEFIAAVGIWVFNSRGEILLTKRHPDKKYAPNLWENTGGHVAAGETSEEAVVRELKEETGIEAGEAEVHYIGTVKVPPYFGDNYYVRKDIPAASVVLQEGETVCAKWVAHGEFLKMADRGELAPSVVTHLAPIRDKFEAALFSSRTT